MRRRLNILTLICCSLLCTMVGVNGVLADTGTNGAEGNPGSGNSCGNGNLCYKSATGIRITLVNEKGKRCYKSGNDLCVSSSTKNAKESKSIDYWFSSEDLPSFSNIDGGRKCIAYNKKRTKSEFISNLSTNGIVACTDKAAYGTLYDIGGLGFPKILTIDTKNSLNDKYLKNDQEKWNSTNVTEARRMPVNVGNIVNFFQCSQDLENDTFTPKEFNSNKPIDCSYKNTNVREVIEDKIINNIIINAYNDDSLLISKNTNATIYLQVEQLISLSLTPGSNYSVKDTVYMGTVAEVAYMFNNYYKQNTGFTHRFGLLGTELGSNGNYYSDGNIAQIGGGSSAITTGIMNGFYAKDTKATNMSGAIEDISINKFLSGYINNDGQSTITDNKLDEVLRKYYSNDTANIFSIWINPALGANCDDDFQNLIGVIDKEYFENTSGVDKGKLIKHLNANKDKYKALIKDCAVVNKNGDVIEFKTGENSCPLLENLDKMSLVLSSKMNTSNYGCFTDIGCSDVISAIKSENTFGGEITNIIKYMNQNASLDGFKFSGAYTKIMEWMNNIWDKYPRLNASIWAYLGDKGPSCADKVPDCPVKVPDMNCDNSGNVVFSTSTDAENCIKQGVAYTTNNKKDIVPSINRSYSSECVNCNVYCDEKVTFNLANQDDLIKAATEAGTLLKWGRSDNSQIFGTMTVKQKCYVVANKGSILGENAYLKTNGTNNRNLRSHLGSVSAGIDVDDSTAKYVNTKITIAYKNPAYYLKDPNSELNQTIKLRALPTTSGVESVKYINDKMDPNPNMKDEEASIGDYNIFENFALNEDKYREIKEFTNYAHYVFAYGKYSGCSAYRNGFCVRPVNIDGGVDGKSELAWYSSKSDNNNYKTQDDYEKASSLEKNSYVFIGYGLPTPFTSVTCIYSEENISDKSKNGKEAPITVTIENIGTAYKNQATIDGSTGFTFTKLLETKNKKNISYSCNYKIHNQMFGYENGDSIECDYNPPKGLDVVFRTIDLMDNSTDEELNRAFPGMSGKGITENNSPRKMGSNWNEIYNDGADNGAEKIFNILSSSIYNKEPMYRINLNVSLIQDIRSFNRDMRDDGRDPYSYMGTDTGDGHAGYTFYKEDNDETSYAFSKFLEYLTKDCTTTNRDGEKTSCLVVNYDCVNTNNKAKRSSCHQEWWNED